MESLVIRVFPTNDFMFIMILSLDLLAFPNRSRPPGFKSALHQSTEDSLRLGKSGNQITEWFSKLQAKPKTARSILTGCQ
jgi:hypothetical protein